MAAVVRNEAGSDSNRSTTRITFTCNSNMSPPKLLEAQVLFSLVGKKRPSGSSRETYISGSPWRTVVATDRSVLESVTSILKYLRNQSGKEVGYTKKEVGGGGGRLTPVREERATRQSRFQRPLATKNLSLNVQEERQHSCT